MNSSVMRLPGSERFLFAGRLLLAATGLFAGLCTGLSACSSATVDATIANQGNAPVQLLEVSYPSASFGAGSIAAHSQFHYRFKIQGSGLIKLHFVDAGNKARDFTGPELKEGEQGSLTVTIDPSGAVAWKPLLATRR